MANIPVEMKPGDNVTLYVNGQMFGVVRFDENLDPVLETMGHPVVKLRVDRQCGFWSILHLGNHLKLWGR